MTARSEARRRTPLIVRSGARGPRKKKDATCGRATSWGGLRDDGAINDLAPGIRGLRAVVEERRHDLVEDREGGEAQRDVRGLPRVGRRCGDTDERRGEGDRGDEASHKHPPFGP